MASYFFQRGEERVGPFSLEEMKEFLRDGRVGYTDRVSRQGETAWWPVHSIPELEADARASLVTRGVAADPATAASPARASRAIPSSARTAAPAATMRRRMPTPGRPPRRPGLFVGLAHPCAA